MILAILFRGLLLSLILTPFASSVQTFEQPGQLLQAEEGVFVSGIDTGHTTNGNVLRVLKKTWVKSAAAEGGSSLPLNEQAGESVREEESTRAHPDQEREILSQAPVYVPNKEERERIVTAAMSPTGRSTMDESITKSFLNFEWFANGEEDRACLNGDYVFGGPVTQLYELKIALRAGGFKCMKGEISLTSYQYSDEDKDFYPVVAELEYLVGRISIDCGFVEEYGSDARMLAMLGGQNGGADGYCTCVGFEPFPYLKEVLHIVKEDTTVTTLAQDPVYDNIISPFTIARIEYNRGDSLNDTSLNRVLRFPSLLAVTQLVEARPTTDPGGLYFVTLFLHTVYHAYVEFAKLVRIQNNVKAKTFIGEDGINVGDNIRGLSFRYFDHGYARVPELTTVTVANTNPVEICSEGSDTLQSRSAFGLHLTFINCDDECVSFPSLAKIGIDARSRNNIAVLLGSSTYPAVYLNALQAIEMTNGIGFYLNTNRREVQNTNIPIVQANSLTKFELRPSILPQGWAEPDVNYLVDTATTGTTWEFDSLESIHIDCSSLSEGIFCGALFSNSFFNNPASNEVGIMAPELDSIYVRYPSGFPSGELGLGIFMQGNPTTVRLDKLSRVELLGPVPNQVSVFVGERFSVSQAGVTASSLGLRVIPEPAAM